MPDSIQCSLRFSINKYKYYAQAQDGNKHKKNGKTNLYVNKVNIAS